MSGQYETVVSPIPTLCPDCGMREFSNATQFFKVDGELTLSYCCETCGYTVQSKFRIIRQHLSRIGKPGEETYGEQMEPEHTASGVRESKDKPAGSVQINGLRLQFLQELYRKALRQAVAANPEIYAFPSGEKSDAIADQLTAKIASGQAVTPGAAFVTVCETLHVRKTCKAVYDWLQCPEPPPV